MMDSAQINVDVTAPGATMALALIFLKVNLLDEETDSIIKFPSTLRIAWYMPYEVLVWT